MRTPRLVSRLHPLGVLSLLALGSLVGLATVPGSSAAAPIDVTLVGYGSSIPPGSAPGATHVPGAGPHQTANFTISGSVTALYPGVTRSLVLTVTNDDTVSITVTSVTTAVSSPSTTCGSANVKVTAFSGTLTVAAGKTGKVTVHATMEHTAPNACQGKTFPFKYTGTATAA